jgi:hypothetical protein
MPTALPSRQPVRRAPRLQGEPFSLNLQVSWSYGTMPHNVPTKRSQTTQQSL